LYRNSAKAAKALTGCGKSGIRASTEPVLSTVEACPELVEGGGERSVLQQSVKFNSGRARDRAESVVATSVAPATWCSFRAPLGQGGSLLPLPPRGRGSG